MIAQIKAERKAGCASRKHPEATGTVERNRVWSPPSKTIITEISLDMAYIAFVKSLCRSIALLLLMTTSLALLAQSAVVRYRVSLPHVSLRSDRGERIYSVTVVMHCGRFVAINLIPDDWSVSVEGPVSEETRLGMDAGHGTSSLWHSEDLNGFLTILADHSCFDISGSLVTATFYDGEEHERHISFQPGELILKKEGQQRSPSAH